MPEDTTNQKVADQEDNFTVKLDGPGVNLERTVGPDVAQRIISLILTGRTGVGSATPGGEAEPIQGDDDGLTIGEFLRNSGATENAEKIAAIGQYLKTRGGKGSFTSADVEKGFEDAGEGVPRNLRRDLRKAIRKDYIAPRSGMKGTYFVTGTGTKGVAAKFAKKKQ